MFPRNLQALIIGVVVGTLVMTALPSITLAPPAGSGGSTSGLLGQASAKSGGSGNGSDHGQGTGSEGSSDHGNGQGGSGNGNGGGSGNGSGGSGPAGGSDSPIASPQSHDGGEGGDGSGSGGDGGTNHGGGDSSGGTHDNNGGGSGGQGGGGGSFTGNGGSTPGGGSQDSGGSGESAPCAPLTQGYWKNHASAWPVLSLTLGNWTYTQAQLLTIFGTPPAGDASLILAHQLIAAKLNVAHGTDDAPIASAIAGADALLAGFSGPLPYGVSSTSFTGSAMVNLSATLDDYNNGKITQDCKGVTPESTISVEKVGPEGPIALGEDLSYTITVTSSGPDAAQDVTLNDTLPLVGSGWTLSGPDADACAIADGQLICHFGTMPVDSSASVTLTTTTGSPADCGDWWNTAFVSANDGASRDASTAFAHVACADVSLSKDAISGASPPDAIGFILNVTSLGPETATGVTLTDPLPPGEWAISGPDAGSCSISEGALSCSFGDMASNATASVTVTTATTGQDCGRHFNVAHVHADLDTEHGNDEASATAVLECLASDVSVEKHARNAAVQKGEDVVFDVAVHALGPGASTNVTLTDNLPGISGGWTVGGPDAGACSISGSILTCSFGDVPAGESRDITLTGVTGAPATDPNCDCGFINNLAFVSADHDSDTSNNVAWASTLVICDEVPPESTISIEKVAHDAVVPLGSDVAFDVTVTNSGSNPASLVNVSDVLPPVSGGWTLSGPDAGSCTLVGLGLSCHFGTLGPFESRTITITGHTGEESDCGVVDNIAFVTVSGKTVDSSEAAVQVVCGDVSVDKVAAEPVIAPGDDAVFTLTVHSNGPGPAINVTLTDTLPPISGGWALGGDDAADCTLDGLSLSCGFGNLSEGATRSVTLTGATALDATDCGDHPNTAFVAADVELDLENNAGYALIHVSCSDVGVDKEPLSASVNLGSEGGFRIVVTSFGPEAAQDVSLVDALPAIEGAWTLAGPDAEACDVVNGTVACSFGSLDPNETRSITLLADFTSTYDCGDVANSALVSAAIDTNGQNNQDEASFHVACSDVGVQKTADAAEVDHGDAVGFTIVVTSFGPDAAENVTLHDLLPALSGGWTVEYNGTGSCSIALSALDCAFGTIAPNDTRSVHITGLTGAERCCDCGNVNNLVGVKADVDTNPDNDEAAASTHVVCSDVKVEKSAIHPAIYLGGVAGFAITVTSLGPDSASGVVLTDALPPVSGGWTLGEGAPEGCSISEGALTCDLGTLPSGGSVTVFVYGQTGSSEDCGALDNTATVTADVDLHGANGQDSAQVQVICADVQVQKTADAPSVSAGDAMGFTLVATSNGPDDAVNVTLTDTLPPLAGGWTLGGPDAESCSISEGVLSCSFGDLPKGATRTLTLSGASSTEDCGWIVNLATVHADSDTNPENDGSMASIYVRCADVQVEKTALHETVLPGGTAGFQIVVTSNGPDAATNVTLDDWLPSASGAWQVSGPDAEACTLEGDHLTCSFGALGSGETATILVTTETSLDDCGTLENTARVAADLDLDGGNDASSAYVHVACSDVGVVKTPDKDVVDKGDKLGFTVVVTANGPDDSTNVTLTDLLPAISGGWTVDGPDAADCAIASDVLSCAFGTLASGETRTIHISAQTTFQTPECDCGYINNLVAVGSDFDTNPHNDHAHASVYVRCEDVGVVKETQAIVAPHSPVQFNLTVTSHGPDPATNVTLTDTLPALTGAWTLGGPDAGDCTLAGLALSCAFGTMPDGATRSVTLSADTTREDCGDVSNTAHVASDHDRFPENNQSTATALVDCSVPPESTISLEKVALDAQVDLGQTLGFSLTLTNSGPDAAENATLYDTLPDVGAAWSLSGPDAADCALTGLNLTCLFGTVEVFGQRAVTVMATPTSTEACGPVENVALVFANDGGSADRSGDSVSVRCGDPGVEKTAFHETVDAGSEDGFTIVVSSHGPDAATNVTLTDELPPIGSGWTLGGPDAEACSVSEGTLTCDFGDVPAGQTRTITLTGTPGAQDCDGIVNTAHVAGSLDTNPDNDASTASFSVRCGDVTVQKTARAPWVAPGSDAIFDVTVTSLGPGPAFNVTLADALPAVSGGWTLSGPDSADCSLAGLSLSCGFGDLPSGATRTVTLTGHTTLEECSDTLRNTARVAADVDLNPENDASYAAIHVTCSDVTVEKRALEPSVPAGGVVRFEVVATSLGPDPATNVTIHDLLPPMNGGWTLGGPDAADCAINATLLTLDCGFGTLSAGENATVDLFGQTIVDPECICGNINNLVFVSADVDLNKANDFAWATEFVDCTPVAPPESALSVEKVALQDPVPFNGTIGFGITVTNSGPDAAQNATLNDTLPDVSGSWTLGGADAADCSIANGTLACGFGAIEVFGSRSITLTAPASMEDCGVVPNTVFVSANGGLSQDRSSATVHVTCADVGVQKTANEPTVKAGDPLTFTIVVTSYGPDAATGVVLTDALPPMDNNWTFGGDSGDCALAALTLTCSFGTLQPGEHRTITATVVTDVSDGCVALTNTAGVGADVDTNASNDHASATAGISSCKCACPLTQGYWKNHPYSWPVGSLTLGSQTYTKAQLLAILGTSVTGDASVNLAHQLIAAKLNVARGTDPPPIASTLAAADALLATFGGALPYHVTPSSATGIQMTALASTLDQYNNRLLTPQCPPETGWWTPK